MSETFDTAARKERVVLVAVDCGDENDVEKSLNELQELADTAGAEVVGRLIQNREKIHPATYIGKGKIEELREMIRNVQAETVISDDELSPAQLGNLEEMLETKIIDRTVLILDIFADRASTKEGKIQVELAQLRYRSSRLIGLGRSLSRMGGQSSGLGIGNKGPGEKKLELNRRLIKERMTFLYKEVKDVVRAREVLRKQRSQNVTKVVAIVGYTNAGKSTLLNTLTDAGVLQEDKLFATLDPTTRSFKMENGQEVLFTDTVGFINKLPHHLIDAFRSTLEEAKYADAILHVVDASNPNYEHHMEVVYKTLKHLGVEEKPIITVFNKMDQIGYEKNDFFKDGNSDRSIKISAKERVGLEELLATLEEILNAGFVTFEKTFSYTETGKIQVIRKYGQLLEEEYRDDGVYVKASIPHEFVGGLL